MGEVYERGGNKMRLEIDEAINGYRVNVMWDSLTIPFHKENTDTRLEGLRVLGRLLSLEIEREEKLISGESQ